MPILGKNVEVLARRIDRVGGGLTETADRRVAHGAADFVEQRRHRRRSATPPPDARFRRGTGRTDRTILRGKIARCGAESPSYRRPRSKSITTPEPSVAPAARASSNVSGIESASGATNVAGRPAEQNRSQRRASCVTPPANSISVAQCRSVRHFVEAGIAAIAPERQKSRVPVDSGVPIRAYACAAFQHDERKIRRASRRC